MRSAWSLARDPDDPDGESGMQRVCTHVKMNVGVKQQSEEVDRAPDPPASPDGVPELNTARIEQQGTSAVAHEGPDPFIHAGYM